jgi:putative ATP-dependent endonuclease of OLD family
MRLRHVRIKGFRAFKDVSVPIDDITVLVGENNAGKTAFLDAIRLVLARPNNRSSSFEDYDYHLRRKGSDSAEARENILIELTFREDQSDEWPETIMQGLNEIVQTDPVTDIDSIIFRVSSDYDEVTRSYVHKTEFQNLNGEALKGKAASVTFVSRFLTYVRLFYLPAYRDVNSEFSSRSQYWGKILRSMNISQEQLQEIMSEVTRLNDSILSADPRMTELRGSLDKIQNIMPLDQRICATIQAVPARPWDLLSRAEVLMKKDDTDLSLPLSRHGQGIQSLSVLFLLQAYIDILLKPQFEEETEAIWALEEPEAHLHPHATRSLSKNLALLKGQKLITSHSPYFIQEVPFTSIRLFKQVNGCTEIRYIKRCYAAEIITTQNPDKFAQVHAKYALLGNRLVCRGKMTEGEYRKILQLTQRESHPAIKQMFYDSFRYLADEELDALNTYAKRVRGEVLFARGWILCEGQSEYTVLRYFAEVLGQHLDVNGITVVDFQNNGSPGAFVGLAQELSIPWVMLCDNDKAGQDFRKQVQKRGLSKKDMDTQVLQFPEYGMDLELYLVKNGFEGTYRQILIDESVDGGILTSADDIARELRRDKTKYATKLVSSLAGCSAGVIVPPLLKDLIECLLRK